MSLAIDPDITAESHIHKALQRAENNSNSSLHINNPNRHVYMSNHEDAGEREAMMQNLSTIPKLFPKRRPSAARIRRWTGRDKVGRKNLVVPLTDSFLRFNSSAVILASQHLHSPKQKHNKKKKVHTKFNEISIKTRQTNDSQFGEEPLHLYTTSKKLLCTNKGSDPVQSKTMKPDIALCTNESPSSEPPITLPSAFTTFETNLKTHNETSQSQFTPKEKYLQICKQLNLSDLCKILSEKNFPLQKNFIGENCFQESHQAQRVIEDYYSKKDYHAQRTSLVVIRLPNSKDGQETTLPVRDKPKFLMRNGKTTTRNLTILEQTDKSTMGGAFLTESK